MLKYQVESWLEVNTKLIPLFFLHHAEVYANCEKIPRLNPDFERYNLMAASDILHLVTIRDNEDIVGYHMGMIDSLLNYQHIQGFTSLAYWIHKSYRGGRNALRLFNKVEESLKERGIKVFFDQPKANKGQGRLLERMGYKKTGEQFYEKWME